MATPHDELFHSTFQHPRHAAGWLASVLPPALAGAIDWSTLRAAPEKVHGHRVRQRITDIVFTAELRIGRHVILMPTEHKSYLDRELHDQVLYYSVNLAARMQKTNGPPALVVPIVLCHGRAAQSEARLDEWPAKARLHPHLEQLDRALGAELAALQPVVRFLIDDLRRRTEAELRRPTLTELAQLTHLCMAFLPGLSVDEALAAIERWGDLLYAVDREQGPPSGRDAVDSIAWYCLQVTEIPDQKLHEVFERHLQRPEETIMSTAERLRREGHAKGRNEGRNEGRADAILRQIEKRFGSQSAATVERVRAASLPELDRWTDRILDAASLDEVFAD